MTDLPSPTPHEEFTDTAGAAEFTKFAPSTLETMRSRGRGPKFYRVGGAVRYAYSDLRAWLTSNPSNEG